MQVEAEIQSQMLDLSAEALRAFCEDISNMFGVEMQTVVEPFCMETVHGLRKRFKKLLAVNTVRAEGDMLNGEFHIVFDHRGLFTLAGVVVMLPENRIKEVIRRCSTEDARKMIDAIAELGNRMVGTWDRVFRENLPVRDGYFKQAGTFIGKPWDDPKAVFGVGPGEEFLFIPAVITIGSYPEFACGVLIPARTFARYADGGTTCETHSASGAADGTEAVQRPAFVCARLSDAAALVSAQQVMQNGVAWLTPDDTVQDAVGRMQQERSGYLMIGSGGVLEGIVSRSDLAGALSPYLRPVFAKWKRPLDDATLQIKLSWIMSRPVHTTTLQTPLGAVAGMMLHAGCRCLPVVDEGGTVHGVVTAFDVFKLLRTAGKHLRPDSTPEPAL
jgi:CBS domain-containing protein